MLPATSINKVKAPEMLTLVQPNSVSIGSRNTQKDRSVPHATIIIKKEAITTIYP
jgi:hypothetical protein